MRGSRVVCGSARHIYVFQEPRDSASIGVYLTLLHTIECAEVPLGLAYISEPAFNIETLFVAQNNVVVALLPLLNYQAVIFTADVKGAIALATFVDNGTLLLAIAENDAHVVSVYEIQSTSCTCERQTWHP